MNDHRARVACLAILAAAVFATAPAARGATATEKCQAVKIKAAGKKVFAKAKCHDKALKSGVAVDPDCLARAEAAFEKAIVKADTIGTCDGTAAVIEAEVDACIANLVDDILPPATSTTSSSSTTTTIETQEPVSCCAVAAGFCTWATVTECSELGGTPGASGTLCNPVNGECTPDLNGAGGCCTRPVGSSSECLAGPLVTPAYCTSSGGTFTTGVCPAPGLACTP